MREILEYAGEISVLVLLALQFVLLIYLFYTTYQRNKADKKFWKKQDEIAEEFLKNAKLLNETEDTRCECEVNEDKE